ncbi:MAG: hypothetical protein IKR74_00165 [Bacilli bacterium]|nr:hypothetical protein [Bacilli bacterium]
MNNNRPKKAYIVIIASIILLVLIGIASYSFFNIGNLSVSNVVNLNAVTEENNMVFDTLGGNTSLNVTIDNMLESAAGTIAAENTTTLNVTFQANTSYSVVCSYDIVWEWTSTDKYQTHTSGVTENEITIHAELDGNGAEGTNNIQSETDLADFVGSQTSKTVVSRAAIASTGSTANTVTWYLTTRFYNVDADQSTLAGKNYTGRFKVTNVDCQKGTVQVSLANHIRHNLPKSGTDVVSNSPWILTSDHAGEWRYAGKNPDNYISFNGELWRIIGVMPGMTYCTGEYGNANECDTTAIGSLVKIIRNDALGIFSWDYKQIGVGSSLSDNGSSDWSDSQLMLMLNGINYLKTGYDVDGNKLHDDYFNFQGIIKDASGNGYYNVSKHYLDENGTTIYMPASATINDGYTGTSGTISKKIESSAFSQIATVKWDLYGANNYSTAAEGNTSALYNKERNINNTGSVYIGTASEKRAVYWYGKIGLMYPSDLGYATNGGSTYDRNTCLGYQIKGWNVSSYKTDCMRNSYLWFLNITSSSPGNSGKNQWTMIQNSSVSSNIISIISLGLISDLNAKGSANVRPALYLKADTQFVGGTGTYNDPYTIE